MAGFIRIKHILRVENKSKEFIKIFQKKDIMSIDENPHVIPGEVNYSISIIEWDGKVRELEISKHSFDAISEAIVFDRIEEIK